MNFITILIGSCLVAMLLLLADRTGYNAGHREGQLIGFEKGRLVEARVCTAEINKIDGAIKRLEILTDKWVGK